MTAGSHGPLKTKVVCTAGPASRDKATLGELLRAGVDVVRINMSHTRPEQLRATARAVRDCADELGRAVGLLVDLQGPKIRLGVLDRPRRVAAGDELVLAPEEAAAPGELPVTYEALADDVRAGSRVLVNDGRVELRVRKVEGLRVQCQVVSGGELTSGKGINLPGVTVSAPALTAKDLEDIELALEVETDYLALSFVRSADNVRELRRRLPSETLILSKIEKDAALTEIEAILEVSDAVMVARGDLGTELPFEQVPLVQKRIVRRANSRSRPVVIATEMLETMIERSRPTRAEVSDVANAILDGTDAVMLSAETAIGRYPVESVRALTRVIAEVEATSAELTRGPPYDVEAVTAQTASRPIEVAVACATTEAVRAVEAAVVLSFTRSGHTARVVSSRRPPVPIVAVTDSEQVRRQLALVWGVLPVVCAQEPSFEAMWSVGRAEILRLGLAGPGQRVVVTAGMPFDIRGTTNMLRIETLW